MATAVAKSNGTPKTIKEYLNSAAMIDEIGKALPSHLTPERMSRVAITAITRTPKLAQCTPESFFKCLLDCSQWGLEPDGRRAHLVPYGRECTLIFDYKGIVELCYRSGVVRNIHADVVREGDLFAYNLGRVERHTPWAFLNRAERPEKAGEIVAAYCIVELDGGTTKCEVMTKEEIDGIRTRSKAGRSGPWVTDYPEMAKKTVFRRCSKWLPLSAEIHGAIERDDDKLIDAQNVQQLPPGVSRSDGLLAKLTESEPEADEQGDATANGELFSGDAEQTTAPDEQ